MATQETKKISKRDVLDELEALREIHQMSYSEDGIVRDEDALKTIAALTKAHEIVLVLEIAEAQHRRCPPNSGT